MDQDAVMRGCREVNLRLSIQKFKNALYRLPVSIFVLT